MSIVILAEVTVNASNFTSPESIFKLGKFVVVSNPSSVGVNGGDVSTGGQHKVLSPSDAGAIDIFSPSTKSLIVGLLRVIWLVVGVLIWIVVASANWKPFTVQPFVPVGIDVTAVSYTHLRAHET